MDRKSLLLKRLDDIGQSLARTGKGLALLGLGSVGTELDRLDEYSDLDFFAVVKEGCKQESIDNLNWLSSVCPIVYTFLNTRDGYKYLYEDGIFCEMAMFEPAELGGVPFANARIVWKDAAFDESLNAPKLHNSKARSTEWLLGEAITNLYVGLGRYHRGEKLSAARFIQGYAVDRVVELAATIETEQPFHADPFTAERRFETRFPGIAALLPDFIQGYEGSVESARAILAFLEAHFEVNQPMKQVILDLCDANTKLDN